jgi:phosphatidylglycerophosphatase A
MFILFLPLACWVTCIVLDDEQEDDPGWIVADEWLGQWLAVGIALMWMADHWVTYLLAFGLFRIFDIFKPGLVKAAERIGPKWWSIHADDLLAGLFAGAATVVLAWLFGLIDPMGGGQA